MRVEKDEVIATYRATGSIKATARNTGLSEHTVRRLLYTEDEYTSPRANQIAKLTVQGYTRKEIAEILRISQSCVINYSVYSRGPTSCGERSENALRIERCRREKREQQEKKQDK